jgi:hypothetical protein
MAAEIEAIWYVVTFKTIFSILTSVIKKENDKKHQLYCKTKCNLYI